MNLMVTIKNVYGNEMIYPACDRSRTFAKIAQSKTLTRHVLRQIQDLGYTFTLCDAYGNPSSMLEVA